VSDLQLTIKRTDWFFILIIGVVFGSVLSMIGYHMVGLALFDGIVFGSLAGFSITLYSLIFISWMNHYLLPKIERYYWLMVAFIFSFSAGFIGFETAVLGSWLIGIQRPAIVVTSNLEGALFIGILTYVVGSLLYRFVVMRNEKEQANRYFVESRLRSLETQLNPHFIFNALNSVAELIHVDADKAESAVIKLSSFLRNTMKEEALIPLRTELENVQAYIALENIRFSNTIRLHVSALPKEVMMLPKFSIQLLVENAIKHGYDMEKEALNIYVDTNAKQHKIVVSNDGLAMKIKHYGIGLKNLQERLEHLCGGSLRIEATEPPTFIITLGVPNADFNR
jgi:two-component system LytT family sensor kinase